MENDAVLNEMLGELEDDPLVEMTVPAETSNVEASEEVEIMQTDDAVEVSNSEDATTKVSAPKSKVTNFPLSKIKGIMKMDPEVVMVGSEALFTISKAAELFVQTLAKQAYKHTQSQKKKTIQRSHVDAAITGSESLFFLEDALD